MGVHYRNRNASGQVQSNAIAIEDATRLRSMGSKSFTASENEAVCSVLRRVLARDFDGNQSAASGRLGVSQSAISQWLGGTRGTGLTLVRALADHLRVDSATVLSGRLDADDEGIPSEPSDHREITIDAIEREWRDEGIFEEAIKLWRTRIEHATSSHTRPKITEAVRERDRIQGMIDAKMLDADGCIRIMQADVGDAQPTPPPYDPDDPGPPKRKGKP